MNIQATTEILQAMIDTLGDDAEVSMICITLAPDEEGNSETLQVIDQEVTTIDNLLAATEDISHGATETFHVK